MDKGRLIGGIICLALAGLLAVLSYALPENRMMFMIGDTNVPYIPAIILGVVGVVLLLGVRRREEEGLQTMGAEGGTTAAPDESKAALNKRLETIGWGLFLIMVGGFSLVPSETVPKGVWSIGIGVIMIGLNVARYINKIKMSGFTTVLGIISLISGVTQLLGWHNLEGAFLIIILGAYLLVKPWFDRRQLFGKAEEA